MPNNNWIRPVDCLRDNLSWTDEEWRSSVKQHDVIKATFRPTRTDDLRPEIRGMIDKRSRFQAWFVYGEGPYKGQWEMAPCPYSRDNTEWPWPFTVPLCDLVDIEIEEAPDAE